ncbi:MAG TPA: tail fiber domain-containing protein [Chitinophagales bacterium]|nr:tail fiber domain-containing protein [Chitinophagales bacterium]
MKSLLLFSAFSLFLLNSGNVFSQNTFPSSGAAGIGTTSPNASSLLDVTSTAKGVLVPRMTKTQRDAIASPATGLLIYQTNSVQGFYYYNGTAWTAVTNKGADKSLDNLTSPTAVNVDLLPGSNNSINLGSSSFAWRNFYLNGSIFLDGVKFIDNSGGNTFLGATYNGANTGTENTFIGSSAGQLNSSGSGNTFIGLNAGNQNTTGYGNSFIGDLAGYHSTGSGCTFIGGNAGEGNAAANANTFVGYNSGSTNFEGYSNTALGMGSLYSNSSGSLSVAVGDSALFFTNASYNTALGAKAGYSNTSGYSNTFAGYSAGYSNNLGAGNSFFGMQAGFYNTSGSTNSFFGYQSGYLNGGNSNSFFGTYTGYNNLTGTENTFVGYDAGGSNTSGTNSTYLGYQAGINSNGGVNTFVGSSAGSGNTSGTGNVFLGQSAGNTNTTGFNNTIIGNAADVGSSGLHDAIAIGADASVNVSGTVILGSSFVTKWGFGHNCSSSNIFDFANTTAKLTTGGAWTNASDRRLKNNFEKLDREEVLSKINQLYIERWHYIADREPVTHIGPVAQDFYEAFKTGDDSTISTIDPSGVALIGIQALSEQNEELKNEITELKLQVQQLDQALSQCCTSYQSSAVNHESSNVNVQPKLEQNIPNPFDQTTIIKFYLPQSASSAVVKIYSLDGVELKSFDVNQKGYGEISITGNSLPSGVYAYTLIIDGNDIDTKQMILTK